LVPQSQLHFAGPITKVEYQASAAASNALFYEFELRLCYTSLNELTTNFNANYDGHTPVLVATGNPLVVNATAGDWFTLNCSPSFAYDNAHNLIIEARWRNPAGGTEVDVWGYDCGANRILVYKEYNAETGDLSTKVDRFRITWSDAGVTPASFGRVKALLR